MEMKENRTKFVLLSTQRSGSTWVIDTLNRLPNASVYGELLLPEKRTWDAGSLDFPRFIEAENLQSTISARPFTTWTYLKQLYSQPQMVGFKLMYSAVYQYPEVLYYLYRHRIKVVHLVRENYLNMVISSDLKEMTGRAHVQSSCQAGEHPQVHLLPDTLLPRLRRLQKKATVVRKALRASGLPAIEVIYENLQEDNAQFEKIYDFLKVTPDGQMPSSSLRKIRTAGQRDTILNYEEVSALLTSTEFEHLLEK